MKLCTTFLACLSLLFIALTSALAAPDAPRPRLQIINGSSEAIDIFWLKSDSERVPHGSVASGKETIITTTLGHRFEVVGRDDKVAMTVSSLVPVQAVRFDPQGKEGVPAFYTQSVSAHGFPIVASAKVNPYALKEAAFILDQMLGNRPEVREAMVKSGARLCIMAWNEFTTDLPEFARLAEEKPAEAGALSGKDYWDTRARGLGGSETDSLCSCAEENVLCYPGDPYAQECILIHEFAHNIHLRGLVNVDPTFDTRLQATYDAAMKAGLWKGKYAATNHHEYFAEGVQSWFDNNRVNDHDHNHVNTRALLIEYDPGLAAMCREVFGETVLKYTKPPTRLTGHLDGYDPATAPTFAWPERLKQANDMIRGKARERSAKAGGDSLLLQGWSHQSAMTILTTPEGANLPAGVAVEGFPVLVRLHKDWFDFGQAKAGGEDVRFCASSGEMLPHQIEEWDAANGEASIWVRVPKIEGNARQELRVFWGKADAVNESNGKAVFNESNGYASVWHLGDAVVDEVGTLESKDVGTTTVRGMIGKARHLAGGQGVFCGEKIPNYPAGDSAHTTELWFRAEKANGTIIGWGNEGGGRGSKVRMLFQSPPHIRVDSDFSDVKGESTLPVGEWIHVAHTSGDGLRRIYLNGNVDGEAATKLDIKSPARLWLGGWYHNYDFVGDLDEVRVSRVSRSAEWVRLEYENQKAMQTLVGPLVQKGDEFSVSQTQLTVAEGKSATFTAQAGGAQKMFWILKRDGRETVVAGDRFTYTFEAGRVVGDAAVTLQFRAVYPDGVKTRDIAISVKEDIAEPVFTLQAPTDWDGRSTIEVAPVISNLAAMQAKGAGVLKVDWKVTGLATIHESMPGKLMLKRAQNSGKMTVTATLSNGGRPTLQSITINVTEPKSEGWLERTPAKDERPVEGQFFARDDKNEGTLFYHGTLAEAADTVFLKVYADNKLVKTQTVNSAADKTYALTAKLKPGLIRYKVEFGTKSGDRETVIETVSNLVCGDAYIINGQSNALATDTGEKAPPETNEWIRSYGRPAQNATDDSGNLWCLPVWKAEKGEKAELGWWGMELAKRLLESQKMPIFIINAAVGGTRIDQHQRNEANPTDLTTIYGRMLWRVQQAKLTHGIRGILWHQGENNQGTAGPSGDYDWKAYEDYFVAMSGGWKRDFPNLQHTYVFQIWPNSCSMAGNTGAGDMIREIQRSLPRLYSNMSIMSTLGIKPPGGCHFPLVGWAEFARLIQPLIERDNYGKPFTKSLTPPNVLRARFTSPAKDVIAIEFDQPIVWDDALTGQFYLDGAKDKVASGTLTGNMLTLKLRKPSTETKITYLKESEWSQDKLVIGVNGIAAFSFCDVPVVNDGAGQ